MPTHQDLWGHLHGKDLAYERDYQYQTAVSYVAKDGTVTYSDADRSPGVASHPGPAKHALGSFVKLDAGDPDNPLNYARVLDSGTQPNEMEGNITTMQNMGMTDPDPATNRDLDPDGASINKMTITGVAENPKANQSVFSPDENLDNENTMYAGWLADHRGESYGNITSQSALDQTMAKYENDPEFQDYKKRVQKALSDQEKKRIRYEINGRSKTGPDIIRKGVDDIFGGSTKQQIAIRTSPTLANDMVDEGTWGLYGGPQRQPIATVGHRTKMAKNVLNGLPDVGVGGPSTTQTG
jgi:hypothetical protein